MRKATASALLHRRPTFGCTLGTVSTAPKQELPFKRLGEFEVLAPIAEGGMATVWLARSSEGAAPLVALKVIRALHARNKEFVAMLRDEAQIASRLSHPNIIVIHGLGHDGKRHYLAMEVLRGRSLADLGRLAHARGVRIPFGVIAWIGARIADALDYAHGQRDAQGEPQDVVHRDVNPGNIFLTYEGVPKLIDFGLAKARDRLASTAFGIVKGTLAYLAPEQVQGHQADRRTDVFALGVTLWEVSLDRRLFREDSDVETVRRVHQANVPNPATLDEGYPVALGDAITRALAREPRERWQTAGELRDALDAFVRGEPHPIGPGDVATLLRDLCGSEPLSAWESLAEDAAVGPDRIRVWDDDRQKLTWMNVSIEAGDGEGGDRKTEPSPEPPGMTVGERLDRALARRLTELATDPKEAVTRARLHLERALVDEILGDGTKAAGHATASLATMPSAVAHAALRRLEHARGAARSLLVHLDAEIADCALEPARASLLAERARILDASGASPTASRAAWEQALSASPVHPAALRGLEAALLSDPDHLWEAANAGARRAAAAHLGLMAEAYGAEPRLAAWLQVERAALVEGEQPEAAKAALGRALQLDGSIGPVRAACVAHAVVHRDAAWLVELLVQEAGLVTDRARAGYLELDAACVARHRLHDPERAVGLLERAAAHAPAGTMVHRRALDDLIALYESAGRGAEALRVRSTRLSLLEDPRTRAHEQRTIAAVDESLGARRAAIAALESAIDLAPDDATVAHELDRMLAMESLTERRIELWVRQAAATPSAPERARRLAHAARLTESLGDRARAAVHQRAALVAEPADLDAIDGLIRLLASPLPEAALGEVRARISVHAHAAEHSADQARCVAHLEAIAVLEEEIAADPARAMVAYEAVLRLDPGRRSALLGLGRTAARSGQLPTLARALLEEAGATADLATAADMRIRAADALAPSDPERALGIAQEVLAGSPGHPQGRLLEQRLYESSGRWAQVDVVLAARIQHATDDRERVDLWMARSELQRGRLRAPKDALASLRAALAIDPRHPAAREALATQLEALGDAQALRDGLVELASTLPAGAERARALIRAAEVDELVLLRDEDAAVEYERALADVPDEAWAAERRARVLHRRAREGHAADLWASLEAHGDRGSSRAFELATALLDHGGDTARATSLVDTVLAQDPTAPHALRTLERIARATRAAPLLANALAQQADAFSADAPKLGALWAEAALVEWTLPGGDASETMARILRHAPTDRAALDAAIRLLLPRARAGDAEARARVVGALAARLEQAASESERLYFHLALALCLESAQASRDSTGALEHYREALRIDPLSVVAADGVARLAAERGDAEAVVAAALAHAELAGEPKRRAILLVQAAGQILNASDARLGTRPERLARASELLERALDADPEGLVAIGLLAAVRGEDGMRDRLLQALRAAFDRAVSPDVVVQLGAEVARVAALPPADHVLAIEALRRVLAIAPRHPSTLRALADQYVAQGAWGEAVEALETLAVKVEEPAVRLGALFQLAELYTLTLRRPELALRALRTALDVDPTSIEALRRLLSQRRSAGAPPAEVAQYLMRLAELESLPAVKAGALSELADLSLASNDVAAAEQALVEATAQAPTAERLSRVLALYPSAPAEQVRLLSAIVSRGDELDRSDPACLAALGQLEVGLGQWAQAVAHLRVALGLAPGLHEARAALAVALAHSSASGEAVAIVLQMLVPDASPLLCLGDPAGALATLERALSSEGRRDEAVVARELRAIAGGLDDGAHVELRTRRLAFDPAASATVVLVPSALRASIVPPDVPAVFLDLAEAVAGAEGKIAPADRGELGIGPRSRLAAAGGQPVIALVRRLATVLGIAPPEVALSSRVSRPRVAMVDGPWLVLPESLVQQPEPVLAAALTRPLVRMALSLSWLDALPGIRARAVLCGAARQVDASFASELPSDQEELVTELTRTVGRAIGRKQKKALAELVPVLASLRAPTVGDIAAFEEGIARTELRVAFLMTGDLLATLDCVRAADGDLAAATAAVGPSALAATLRHPLAGDLVTFALSRLATDLRLRIGSVGRPA